MMKELEKQIKSFFDEYDELKEKCKKLMRNKIEDWLALSPVPVLYRFDRVYTYVEIVEN